jgi:large conductance mechanosensitive channel
MLKEFRDFVLRGNVIDLAVAVVIGAAFGAVVTALVADFLTPLIAAIGGQPDFSALQFTINGSAFRYGDFLNKVLSFLFIGLTTRKNTAAAMKRNERTLFRKSP